MGIFSLLIAAPASASGILDGGFVVVHIEDRYGYDCSVPTAGFCFFDIERSDTVGEMEVDVYQQIFYVGVATDFSMGRSLLGEYWLLEDRSVSQDASDIYVRHGVFENVTTTWSAAPHIEEPIQIEMTPSNVSVTHPAPSFSNPTSPPYPSRVELIAYDKEDWVRYDYFGPVNRELGSNTDNLWNDPQDACKPHGPCWNATAEADAVLRSSTPNITWGISFQKVQVATNPENLTPPRQPTTELLGAASARPQDNSSKLVLERRKVAVNQGEKSLQESLPREPHLLINPPIVRQDLAIELQNPPPPEGGSRVPLDMVIGAATSCALLFALGYALYSRFNNKDEALKSEMRNRILALIRDNPGICLSDAAERMGVARNTIRHHLRVLERVGLVRVEDDANLKVYYPAGAQAIQVPAWLRRNETCLRILRAIAESATGLSREDVRALLPEMPDRTRNYHLQRLLSVGALEQVEDGSGAPRLRVAPRWSGAGEASGTA